MTAQTTVTENFNKTSSNMGNVLPGTSARRQRLCLVNTGIRGVCNSYWPVTQFSIQSDSAKKQMDVPSHNDTVSQAAEPGKCSFSECVRETTFPMLPSGSSSSCWGREGGRYITPLSPGKKGEFSSHTLQQESNALIRVTCPSRFDQICKEKQWKRAINLLATLPES